MSSAVSIGPAQDSPIGTTLERHLLDRQRRMPQATGDFTGLFQQISLAAKIIGSRVSKAGLSGILGRTGTTNVQGEQVQKLDDFANSTIVSTVEAGGHVCVMGSEEVEEPIQIPAQYPQGKYVLQFDPLDGSGNIDINASIGTIFSIHRRVTPDGGPGTLKDLLQRWPRYRGLGLCDLRVVQHVGLLDGRPSGWVHLRPGRRRVLPLAPKHQDPKAGQHLFDQRGQLPQMG